LLSGALTNRASADTPKNVDQSDSDMYYLRSRLCLTPISLAIFSGVLTMSPADSSQADIQVASARASSPLTAPSPNCDNLKANRLTGAQRSGADSTSWVLVKL
jgi:hypothetical protein